jgi:hypothetical protein
MSQLASLPFSNFARNDNISVGSWKCREPKALGPLYLMGKGAWQREREREEERDKEREGERG